MNLSQPAGLILRPKMQEYKLAQTMLFRGVTHALTGNVHSPTILQFLT